jgi:uncharacterized protein YbjT (DUF2867 family)
MSALLFVAGRVAVIQDAGGNAMTTVIVFGGTGFLGRRLVRRLVAEGATVRAAVRHPEQARNALRAAGLDGVTVFRADVRDQASVTAAVAGADAVVNAVSAYVEKGGVTSRPCTSAAPRRSRGRRWRPASRVSSSSPASAPIPDRGRRTSARGRGELVVRQAFPGATIIRPGAMFGPGDAVFGTLAELARLLPVLPLIGGGRTRLQPVYVEDVAEAISRMLADSGTAGQTYEVAGPEVYTLRELDLCDSPVARIGRI